MKQSLLKRFMMWLCDKLGHFPENEKWTHAGMRHKNCSFCGRIISTSDSSEKEE